MKLNIALLIIITSLIVNCSSVPEIHYYLLDYQLNDTDSYQQPKFDKILGVQKFDIAPLYDQDKIVYRESVYEGKFYNYHRWIAPLDEMITEKTIEHITASDLFQNVIRFPADVKVDYILAGKILAFEEWDQDQQWFAHIRLMLELIESNDRTTLWKDIIDIKNPVPRKQPLDLVKAMNEGFKESIENTLIELESSISGNN
ncbi:membrane integrity-associated transporter subunit PqiC [candidate division KSB1 bacterium]|nr:membrane integrity-associated transporter subunit PqiC [candidate division KSB1 bacterium]